MVAPEICNALEPSEQPLAGEAQSAASVVDVWVAG
jgi:hypothetical protein